MTATATDSAVCRVACDLIHHGIPVVPVPPGRKGPVLTEWQRLRISVEDVPQYFGNGENIGIILGEPSGLVDVDLDCPEATSVADIFLPQTGMAHGRPSKRRSHRWYRPTPISATKQYKDINGVMLVELRSTGGQTLIPPSVHPSGETFAWDVDGDPAAVDAATLQTAVAKVAAAALVARHWPAKGSRHEASKALAGLLCKAEWDEQSAMDFIEAVAFVAHDEEWADRKGDVRTTVKALAADKKVTGGPTLAELLSDGAKILDRLSDWLALPKKGDPALPAELRGRQIHPALHLDDHVAAVAILRNGKTWRTITHARTEHDTIGIKDALTFPPVNYPALGERWRAEDRARYVAGDSSTPSWAHTVATTLTLFRDYLEFDTEPPYAVLALWSLGTYFHPMLPSFPRLNLHGEKGSGKSKTLRMVATVAHNGLYRTAPRPAGLFRLIQALRPTFCLDEIEHLDRDDKGDILAILNAGYQAGGAVDRCVGDEHTVTPFNVYAPIALAGIKGLNAVLSDRCVTLVLQPGRDRAKVNRDVDPNHLDDRVHAVRDEAYRLALTRWTEVRGAWATLPLPLWLNGRSRELWAPLLTLAALVATETPRLDLRPALLAVARPDAVDRAELPEMAAAILTALEKKLDGADTVIVQPGDLADDLKGALGYPVTPTVIGLRLKALGFTRDRGRKGGSYYTITADQIQTIRDRRALTDDAGGVYPPER